MIISAFLIKLRRITRKLGFNSLIGSFFANDSYEDRFGSAIQSKVRQGDVVWDVGANLGLYTEEFLSCVGESGVVFAFERVPALFQKLGESLRPKKIEETLLGYGYHVQWTDHSHIIAER